MLGGSCSPCCEACSAETAAALTAQLKTMTATMQVTQSGYVPQQAISSASVPLVVANSWGDSANGTTASLADAQTALASSFSSAVSRATCSLWEGESQISTSPYLLALDASQSEPTFMYDDAYIKITATCGYTQGSAYGVSGLSKCSFNWTVKILKKRRQALSVPFSNVFSAQTKGTTYGPDSQQYFGSQISFASAAKWLDWDYVRLSTLSGNQFQPFRTSKGADSFSTGGFIKTSAPQYSSYGNPVTTFIYINSSLDQNPTEVTFAPDASSVSLSLGSQTRSNNAFAMVDRDPTNATHASYASQPNFKVTRSGPIDAKVDYDVSVSGKTFSLASSSYTVAAVLTLSAP